MTKGYTIKDDLVIINRELTQLDIFLRDFLRILKKEKFKEYEKIIMGEL